MNKIPALPCRICLLLLCVWLPAIAWAQRVQRVRGVVVDKESKMPLIGVTVAITDMQPPIGAATDDKGTFAIDNVPVGKHTVTFTYLSYQSVTLSDVLVTSAKEVVLPAEMEEQAVKLDAVLVARRREHINEMALVSTQTFDVQQTERYAGSRADPARMASNFAGAQGGDDSRNDIIIRGNSPQGILWRLEGVDIPNPSHFSIPGTTGGPVSILNSKTLANSDFFMGAFLAEYGNAVAGVFDVRLRNGNSERHEFSVQFGFLGTELATEGPLSGKGASYLFTYRYSTLQIFQGLNIKIGTSSVPNYQDATFKLNFPVGKRSDLSFFGIGGLSNIDLVVSKEKQQSAELYDESDRDQYFTSNTGVVGASFSHTIDPNTYTKVTIAETGNDVYAHHDFVFHDPATFAVDSLKYILGYRFITTTTTLHWYLNKKLSNRQTLRFGIVDDLYQLRLSDSSRQFPVTLQQWQHREDYTGSTNLVQAYVQYKYRPTDRLTFTASLHGQYLTHNSTKALEPRAGMRWAMSDKDVLTAGYGLHSMMQPLYQYFAHKAGSPASDMLNYNMDFTRSHHMVVGYDRVLGQHMHMKLEGYYQFLFNVPIETTAGSSYSAIDQGTGYSRYFPDTLQNKGTGYNYGLELTLEKGFSHGYYVLFTGSVYDSKARGNDGVYRNTDYNTHFTVNLLGGYERKLGSYSTLITGIKITCSGGKLYSPVNVDSSIARNDLVIVDSQRNSLQFHPYFRADVKLGMRFNAKKVTHELGLDLVNVFNTKNVLSENFSYGLYLQTNKTQEFYYTYQLGFLPIFYYRIDFGLKPHRKS